MNGWRAFGLDAIRRASSRVISLAAPRRPGTISRQQLVQIVFDQSILASLRDPIVDQVTTYRARDHEAASCEPV